MLAATSCICVRAAAPSFVLTATATCRSTSIKRPLPMGTANMMCPNATPPQGETNKVNTPGRLSVTNMVITDIVWRGCTCPFRVPVFAALPLCFVGGLPYSNDLCRSCNHSQIIITQLLSQFDESIEMSMVALVGYFVFTLCI